MFVPCKTKFKKTFRPRDLNKKAFHKNNKLCFGAFGFKAIQSGWIKSSHLEAIRRVLSKALKKEGKFWCKIFPNWTITNKPLEVRMGRGKGNIAYWVFPVKSGTVLYEFSGIDLNKSIDLFNLCKSKLPILTKFVMKL